MAAEGMHETLAAILAADAAGYSRLMDGDERATVAALDAARQVFRRHIESHRGRVVDMAGDSVLAVFDSAAGAASAALAVQAELDELRRGEPDDRRLRFRIGLHLGDLIEKADGSVYGSGVNVAARLQALAEPGGITASESIRGAVRGKVAAEFQDQGEQQVKNIADPVRAFAVKPTADLLRAVAGVDVSRPVPGFGGRPAIAVLPFANLSADPEQEYFADGLADDILTRLSMWRWVPVIARNSSFSCRGRHVDIKEVGRALGARYVLEGSVRKAGNRLRVTGQLIEAATGYHLWAERYDRVLDDLFAIQDELTDGIVGALEGAVGHAETERARLMPPANLDAWDCFQRGWWHLQRFTREDFAAAESLFLDAARRDPSLAGPHSGLASLRTLEAYFLWSRDPRQAFAEAVASARKALAADPLDAFSYSILGLGLAAAGQHDEALAMCRKGVEINPSFARGHNMLAVLHQFRGEPQPSIVATETAIRISPNDALLTNFLATLSAGHYLMRDYAKAAEIAQLGVLRGPNHPLAWRHLANALGQLGRIDEAREALAGCLALMPGFATESAARASLPFRDEAVFQHTLEGLRKAGWAG
jgi:adenylate cyclase